VQSALAKGALRPRSRFGAALQPLSTGQAVLHFSRASDLHLLAAFELEHFPAALAAPLERYAPALALAEVMQRFAPAAPHPEAYDVLRGALDALESLPAERAGAAGLRWLWRLVGELGFTPALEACVRDGAPVAAQGPLAFSPGEGGALCADCARSHAVTWLPAADRADLAALLAPETTLPGLDAPHAAAHRRLLARFIRHQLDADTPLRALDFWQQQPWEHR
jgi:DNA repair protein RecO (recombination protein O)